MKNTYTLGLLSRLSLLVTLFVLICFCGCDIDYDETIGIDPQEKSIGLEGGSFTVDFRSYVKWTSSTQAEWLRIDPAFGKGDTVLTITAEGQSDAAVRGVFKARQSEWRSNLEKELLRIAPNATIKSITHTDEDRYLEQPVSITYSFSIPNYATFDGNSLIFIPLSARNFYRRAMGHLSFDTTLVERTQPFADRCSRLVDIKETITLPGNYTTMDYYAKIPGVVSPAVNYGCGFQIDGNKFIFGETVMLNKRVYDATDWPAFRQAVVNQNTVASTPVILYK